MTTRREYMMRCIDAVSGHGRNAERMISDAKLLFAEIDHGRYDDNVLSGDGVAPDPDQSGRKRGTKLPGT